MMRSVAPERMARALRGSGLEIGAFRGPQLLPEGRVTYVDLLSRAEALRFYPEVPAHIPVVDPDVLAPAADLSVFPDCSQDFIVASHLLEHTEDPISALVEWHRVLKSDGLIYLGLPDMRDTFDRERTRTTLEHLIDDHRSTPAELAQRNLFHYREWAQHVNDLDDPGRRDLWAELLQAADYPIHFHCWNPEDLPPVVEWMHTELGYDLEILDFESMSHGYEFCYLIRRRGGTYAPRSP